MYTFFLFGSDPGKLAQPSSQATLETALGFRDQSSPLLPPPSLSELRKKYVIKTVPTPTVA